MAKKKDKAVETPVMDVVSQSGVTEESIPLIDDDPMFDDVDTDPTFDELDASTEPETELENDAESTPEEKDALVQAIDEMFDESKPKADNTSDKEPLFINCKDFKLAGLAIQKNRKYSVVALADGAVISDSINQGHALGTTDLDRSLKLVSDEIIGKVFGGSKTVRITKLSHEVKQNKKKEQTTKVKVAAEDQSGIALIKHTTEVDAKDLGTVFSTHFAGLEQEIRHIMSEARSSGGVQQDLFGEHKTIR